MIGKGEPMPGLAGPGGPSRAAGARDPRLDLFRGLAMLIIFMAHVPWNYWADFIPARWGASDAAEMFVFCSGYAAALAFGGTFLRAGFALGTVRILFRCWQIYWAHLSLFIVVLGLTFAADRFWPRTMIELVPERGLSYLDLISLSAVLTDLPGALVGLLTLRWIPNYFDILPMYMIVLVMVPIVMALHRLDPRLVLAFVVGLYATNRLLGLDLPAEPWGLRPWFFNPFAWQLLFFTGFALARGWLPRVPYDRRLAALALGLVVVMVPVCQYRLWVFAPWLETIYDWLLGGEAKSDFYLTRYLHFLALAYLAIYGLHRWPSLLRAGALRPIIKVGQQALPAFLTSMTLAWAGGMVLDHLGRTAPTYALVNLGGVAIVIGVAYVVGWIKGEPWQRRNVSVDRHPREPASPLSRSAPAWPAPSIAVSTGDAS